VVINDRWGKDTRSHHGGYFTTEYGEVGGGERLAANHKCEENRGIGSSFGYNRHEALDEYQTSYGLICLLANLVSKGSNLLLDVGPTADGRIPVIMQQRLADIGDWLKVNGEAIYGTHPWKLHGEGPTPPVKDSTAERKQVFQSSDVRFTTKGDVVYAISLALPTSDVSIKSLGKDAGLLSKPVKKVTMLGSNETLKWTQDAEALVIHRPQSLPCAHAVTFAVSF
jgi:alpha-L-fucosidase